MDIQDDGLTSFGEGFDGFPKHLPEDCVEYSIFIIGSKLNTQKELLAQLENVRKESLKLTDSLLEHYIWQRESFKLEIKNEKGSIYMHGLTNYGDSVEDEWLIVYMLRELSNRFPELWIKVVDTDGEFLLIEAANALPRWLNPEIADNRVWIHHNRLRVIPLAAASSLDAAEKTAPISRSLTIEEARDIILSTPNILINSPLIEEEAFYRLRNYPECIRASTYHALITIPRKLAFILHSRPASIAPATEAFYLRDQISLKALQANLSDLVFAPQDLVSVSTRFTKVLYAQLKSQQFEPPTLWTEILTQKATVKGESDKTYSQIEMGMKVTSGFEMLVMDSKHNDSRVVRELKILLDDLADGDTTDLPSDQEIASWEDVGRDDDESWLDINFEDFEKELQGRNGNGTKSKRSDARGPDASSGFGDAKTQADLRKMVERFESFLNDDQAGIDGAEVDEMDFDDDDDHDDEDDSEDEDKDISFDEKEFARMMREMMGMPPEEAGPHEVPKEVSNKEREFDSSDEEGSLDEAREIVKVMERMEVELKEAGALNLDSTLGKPSASKGKAKEIPRDVQEQTEEDSDEDVNIDYDLAKNLLESFRSQAGMAGPGGNLLAALGLHLPRDEDDTHPEA